MATDIFLYAGEPNPPDIRLSDPTVPRGGSTPVTTVISETLLNPIQAIVATLVFPAQIAESLPAPTQALAGDVTAPSTGVTFVLGQSAPPPTQWIQIFDGYSRVGTGAAGNYHDKDTVPRFKDPGKSVKYDGRRIKVERVLTQSAPPPSQGITMDFRNKIVITFAEPVVAESKPSKRAKMQQDEDELLLMLMEAL